jgi:hypothetical protein
MNKVQKNCFKKCDTTSSNDLNLVHRFLCLLMLTGFIVPVIRIGSRFLNSGHTDMAHKPYRYKPLTARYEVLSRLAVFNVIRIKGHNLEFKTLKTRITCLCLCAVISITNNPINPSCSCLDMFQ